MENFISIQNKCVYGDRMVDKAVSTGKNISLWADDETIAALDNEAKISGNSKSKVFRIAMMRYSEERSLEREYLGALEDIRSRKYD